MKSKVDPQQAAAALSVSNGWGAEVEYIGLWNGQEVFSPVIDPGGRVGLPLYILIREGAAELAEPADTLSIFDSIGGADEG